MALTIRKTFSFINARLYRYQWNAVKKFSTDNKPQISSELSFKSPVLDKLTAEYGNSLAFKILLHENPYLLHMNYSQWSGFFRLMDSFGFKVDETLSMIRDCPDIIKMSEEDLRNMLEIWYHRLQILDNREARTLLYAHPQYLIIPPKKLKLRVHMLTDFVERKKKSLTLMLLQCPNVLFDDHDRLLEKMNYLVVNWRFTPIEIARCRALTYPLDYLKTRMTLVEKCGIYKMPYPYIWKKKKKELMKNRNPHLKYLVDTSDEDFAENVAKITSEEYEVYKVLFEETMQLEADMDSDEEVDYDETDL